MRYFLLNILLALAWAALTGSFSLINLLAGFIFGYIGLWIMQFVMTPSSYFAKIPQVIIFTAYFAWELFKANVRMAYHVLAPADQMHPGIIGIPLDITTDTQITMLANMITLTPGTLTLEVSSDRKVLYVHSIQVSSAEDFIDEIKSGFEQKVLEITG